MGKDQTVWHRPQTVWHRPQKLHGIQPCFQKSDFYCHMCYTLTSLWNSFEYFIDILTPKWKSDTFHNMQHLHTNNFFPIANLQPMTKVELIANKIVYTNKVPRVLNKSSYMWERRIYVSPKEARDMRKEQSRIKYWWFSFAFYFISTT